MGKCPWVHGLGAPGGAFGGAGPAAGGGGSHCGMVPPCQVWLWGSMAPTQPTFHPSGAQVTDRPQRSPWGARSPAAQGGGRGADSGVPAQALVRHLPVQPHPAGWSWTGCCDVWAPQSSCPPRHGQAKGEVGSLMQPQGRVCAKAPRQEQPPAGRRSRTLGDGPGGPGGLGLPPSSLVSVGVGRALVCPWEGGLSLTLNLTQPPGQPGG